MDDEVSAEIMGATYRALCEHGFADLTMQDIADEWGKSKAALHYHYDSKHALLLAFLDHLYDRYVERLGDPEGDTPAARLRSVIDAVLQPPKPDDHPHEAFGTAILELKAQAPYDEAIRTRLGTFDAFLFEAVRDHVAAGIEAEQFRAVDPADTARFIVTAVDGARTKEVAIGQELDVTRRMLQRYVDTHLATEEPSRGTDDSKADAVTE
jgi:AcrR family transcriptional regulator